MSITSIAVVLIMTGSFYAGFCFYIGGMVLEMKTRITYGQTEVEAVEWAHYVREINFHDEIIGYDFGHSLSFWWYWRRLA